MEAIAAAQDDSSSANPSSVKSDDSSPRHDGGRNSPPPKCAICLGTCRNKSFTDSCLHQFCFKCLLTWSKVKAECPLCKQNFRSIIHNVRSNHQYEEYMVGQREESVERINIENLTASRRFRYRTTLTLQRRESVAIQQLLLHYPMVGGLVPPPVPRRRSPASFRRSVYRYNLWARPLPDFTGRFRDCSPEFYRYNDSQMHRLVPWLNRELHYLLNENAGHISYVMTRILELLPQYHINSSEFRETLQRYFGDRTEHFLHELYCYASTPYDMTGYDRNVQYTTDTRISTMVNEVISSSESDASVDSDIVMISSSEPAEPPPGPSRLPAPVYPVNYIPEPTTTQNNVITIETISQSDTDDDSSEVMVVGYIKPPQDRTPEVVDLLGSDSDVIVQDNAPSELPQTSEPQESRVPLVKLKLKRQNNQTNQDTDSDDSAHTPPPPRRKRRLHSTATATTADTCRTTPSPFTAHYPSTSSSSSSLFSSPSSALSSVSSASPSSSDSSSSYSDMSSSSGESSRKRKLRKKTSSTERNKRKSRRSSRSHHKSKKAQNVISKNKQTKRKSYSNKDVKSSKPPADTNTSKPDEEQMEVTDQPSTSGTSRNKKRKSGKSRKRRRPSRESKRLKSVVKVINSVKKSSSKCLANDAIQSSSNADGTLAPENATQESSPSQSQSSSKITRAHNDHSDSDDDLPLNLSIAKTFTSL